MTANSAYNTPTNVKAIDGEVTLDGPDGVSLSMTPAAAAETGARLTAASKDALAQDAVPDDSEAAS